MIKNVIASSISNLKNRITHLEGELENQKATISTLYNENSKLKSTILNIIHKAKEYDLSLQSEYKSNEFIMGQLLSENRMLRDLFCNSADFPLFNTGSNQDQEKRESANNASLSQRTELGKSAHRRSNTQITIETTGSTVSIQENNAVDVKDSINKAFSQFKIAKRNTPKKKKEITIESHSTNNSSGNDLPVKRHLFYHTPSNQDKGLNMFKSTDSKKSLI